MNPEESTTIGKLIDEIRTFQQPPDVPKQKPMVKSLIKTYTFKELNQEQTKTHNFFSGVTCIQL